MGSAEKNNSSAEMTFFEHLDALRPHLFRAAIAIIVFLVAAFLAKNFIVDVLLMGPKSPDFPTNRFFDWMSDSLGVDDLKFNQYGLDMINTTMAGQFTMHLRISVTAAVILVVPYLLFEIWQFIKPALTRRELRGSRMFVLYVSICFFTGLLFGYFVIVPITLNFLAGYTLSPEIRNMIDIKSYLSTVTSLSLACGLVFQLPLLIYFFTRMGLVSSGFLRKYRKHAIVVLLIVAAAITPPDPYSLIFVALPMYGLYELGVLIASRVEKRKAREDAELDGYGEDDGQEEEALVPVEKE